MITKRFLGISVTPAPSGAALDSLKTTPDALFTIPNSSNLIDNITVKPVERNTLLISNFDTYLSFRRLMDHPTIITLPDKKMGTLSSAGRESTTGSFGPNDFTKGFKVLNTTIPPVMMHNPPAGKFQGIVTGLVQFDEHLLTYLLLSRRLMNVTFCNDNPTAFVSFLEDGGTQSLLEVRVIMVEDTAMLIREPYQTGSFKGHVVNSDHMFHEMVHNARKGFYGAIKEKYGAEPVDVKTVMENFYKNLHVVQPPNSPMGPPHQGPITIRSGFKEGKKFSEIFGEEGPFK